MIQFYHATTSDGSLKTFLNWLTKENWFVEIDEKSANAEHERTSAMIAAKQQFSVLPDSPRDVASIAVLERR